MVFGDWRLRFGKIEPSVWVHGNEFRPMLPEGTEMFIVTLGIESFVEEQYLAAADEIKEAAKRLDARGVDCVVAGGSPAYTYLGPDGEDELIEEVDAELDAGFSTNLRAHVDALRTVGAERIILVTPYPEKDNDARITYLEERGFEVVANGGIHRDAPREIAALPQGMVFTAARSLAREADEPFDAVYISNPQWESARFVEQIERDLGCPVVADAQAQVWKGFQLAGVSPDMTGWGSLFEATS